MIDMEGVYNRKPVLRYVNRDGDRLVLEFGGERSINGVPENHSDWLLMENPCLHQMPGGDPLVMRHGGQVRTYDFVSWTVEENGE
jgi:hypothetical protein